VIVIAVICAIPLLARELIGLIQLLPDLFYQGQAWVMETFPDIQIPQSFDDLKQMDTQGLDGKVVPALEFGKNILGNVIGSGMAVLGFISFMALMPIVAFYLLIDWARLGQKIDGLMPKKGAGKIKGSLGEIDPSLSGFIRGQLSVCFLLGLFYAIALSVMGLEYGFLVGVMAGVLSLIPYIGSLFGLVASVGLAFYQFGGWEYPAIALAIFIIGQLVEGNYLTPKLVGESVGLHPLWVIFALMAGGMLLGFLGMMIAVPVAAVIAVLVRFGIGEYKDSAYYKGKKV